MKTNDIQSRIDYLHSCQGQSFHILEKALMEVALQLSIIADRLPGGSANEPDVNELNRRIDLAIQELESGDTDVYDVISKAVDILKK